MFGEGGPVASYLVAGVEGCQEHQGAGAGHVEVAVLHVEQLRAQEPAGADTVLEGGTRPNCTARRLASA